MKFHFSARKAMELMGDRNTLRRRQLTNIGLALTSIVLLHLSLWFQTPAALPLLALAPFFLALKRTISPKTGFLLGWFFGSALWLSCIWWTASGLYNMLDCPTVIAWTATLLFSLWQGLPYAVTGLVISWPRYKNVVASPLFNASLLSLLILFRPSFYPGDIGLFLAFHPRAIQMAELGGAPLILFFMLLVSWMSVPILDLNHPKTSLKKAGWVFLLIAIGLGYGTLRINGLNKTAGQAAPEDLLMATAIQPMVPIGKKGIQTFGPHAGVLGELVRLTEQAANPASQLILWPEVPPELDCQWDDFTLEMVNGAARLSNAPIMVSCTEFDFGNNKILEIPSGKSARKRVTQQKIDAMYNAIWLVRPDKNFTPVYRKIKLMPFGEQTPFRSTFPGLAAAIGPELEYSAGSSAKVVELAGGLGIQPLICLEIGYPDIPRQGIAKGARAFALMADELWFSSLGAARFQLAHSIYRAVEFRRPVIRCTNSGLGAHILQTGQILPGTLTPFMEKSVVTDSVYCPATITPYSRVGKSWLWLPVLVVIFSLARPGASAKSDQDRHPGR